MVPSARHTGPFEGLGASSGNGTSSTCSYFGVLDVLGRRATQALLRSLWKKMAYVEVGDGQPAEDSPS
jgi:hypothetical protein